MKAEFEVTPKNDYLLIKVSGAFDTIEGYDAFIKDIFESSGKHGIPNILVDARSLQGDLSVLERLEFSKFMAQEYIESIHSQKIKQLRIAFVGTIPLIDTSRFGETVAANRGLKILSTTDINEAFEWFGLEADE
jgi:hypothetical protein